MHGWTAELSSAVWPDEGNSPTIKLYCEYVPFFYSVLSLHSTGGNNGNKPTVRRDVLYIVASNACHQSGYKSGRGWVWVWVWVPVLSVAKKLTALQSTPTAPAAKCGLIRQDEVDWLWLSIGCWKTFALFFSSLLEVITGWGELTECSKLTCFAKRMLDMVPGGNGEWDRRSVSAAARHRRCTCQGESELGKGKKRPHTTYPNSKEEEKAILNAWIQIHERVREPNWGRRSIDELLCACMHAPHAAAVHALVSQYRWTGHE